MMEVWDIVGMLERARSIPTCQYVGSWESENHMKKEVEIDMWDEDKDDYIPGPYGDPWERDEDI